MALVGLRDLHYAKITSENETETVYSEVKRFGPAQALSLTPSVNSGNLRADDGVIFSETSEGATAVSVNTSYLEPEVEADVLGKEVDEDGGVTDSGDDRAPYIAIGGRAANARGGFDYFWIYRVKLAKPEESMETKQETPTFSTPTLTGEALDRLHDKRKKYKLWDENPNMTDQAKIENWFNEVIDKDWVAEETP